MDTNYEGMSAEEAEKSREYHKEAFVNLSMRDSQRIETRRLLTQFTIV
jgi:hypothetical protein